MISFASLFVGLVLGVVDVQLVAAGGVERVELLLDGRRVAEAAEPFRATVDLGCEPAPHELVAVARDAEGRELGRARQWINLPRDAAEATLVLEGGSEGPVARLSWRALVGEAPESVSVALDGVSVPVTDPRRIELPPLDPQRTHVLRALLDFGKGVSASAELVFGGGVLVDARAELTAVAVELEKGAVLPEADALTGWLEAEGRPLRVVAVEEGGLDVVFVAEGSANGGLNAAYERGTRYGCRVSNPDGARALADPAEDLRLRLLWPVPTTTHQADVDANVYPLTRWQKRGRSSIDWIVGCRGERPPWRDRVQRIADAVAVAGLVAAKDARRRAVVLLLGPEAEDGSRLSPDEASRFLARLGVPLHVWSVGWPRSAEAARWGAGEGRLNERGIGGPFRELLERAGRQRILWVEGAHLPQAVVPTPLAKGLRLAR